MTDYRCQIHGIYANGSQWSTRMHVTSNQSESALLTTWSSAVNNAWLNGTYGLQTLFPVGTVVTAVSVATLGPTMRETSKSFLATSYPGTALGDSLPYLNSAIVSLRSNNIATKGRGRLFMPAFEETFVNDDVVISSAVTRMKSAWEAVAASIHSDGSTIFVYNPKPTTDKRPPVIPAFTKEVITNILISNKPARQSRRVRKVAAVYT